MQKIDIIKKFLKINKKVKIYYYYYFYKNKSLITDEEYDFLVKKLEKLITKYPLLKKYSLLKNKINYKFSNFFKKNKHYILMLSIKNTYSYIQTFKYIKKIKDKYKNKKFCCELKIDGIAISLLYQNNKFTKALTRGDGIYGENVTKNILNIKSIPKKINSKEKFLNLEIRGEIYIKKKEFLKINKNKNFSNSRNLVSGTIKSNNYNITKNRKLSFIAYDIIINNNRKYFLTQLHSLNKIKELGFKIEKNTKIYNNIKKIYKYYLYIKKIRKKINFNIDGIVIKVNNKYIQNIIGYNNKYIKWAIAWKFPSIKKKTKIKKIKFKISKNGTIIPIIVIKKVKIGGVIIKNINLYNLNYLYKLKINIKDSVIIERSGDVIPKIVKVIKNNNNKIFKIKKCPWCKSKINIKEKIPKCYNNLKCPQQFKKILIHFVSKKALNIKNLGNKIINKLIKYNYLKSIIDIFKLSINKIIKIPQINIKLAKKIILSIKLTKKNIKLNNLIYALSIPNIGEYTSIKISKKIKTFKNFINLNKRNMFKNNFLYKKQIISIINYIDNNKKLLKKINKILF